MSTATATHAFEAPAADTAEVCTCGAYYDHGFNLQAVKIAHLSHFLTPAEVAAQIVAPLTPGQLDDVATGRTRLGEGDTTLDLAIWNAAIDRENGYDD